MLPNFRFSSTRFALLSVFATSLLSGAVLAQTGAPLRTGVDATFAPHAMVKLDGGLQGFNIDLGEELAKRMQRKIEIEGTEFSGLVPGLNAKKYDFILAPVTVTPEPTSFPRMGAGVFGLLAWRWRRAYARC